MIRAAAVLFAALILTLPLKQTAGFESYPVNAVYLDGTAACQPDMVLIENNICFLPFISTAIAAGYSDIQRDDNGTISVSNGQCTVTAAAERKYIQVDNHYIWLGRFPITDMDELLIPIEPLCIALGLNASWLENIKTISLTTTSYPSQWAEHDPYLFLWLARVIWAEARGECLEGRIAVAQVVLNRMASPYYPDTVTEVLFQPGQFSTADSGTIWNDANEDCFLAAQLALDGADIVGDDCLYFNSCAGYTEGLTYITTIGGHKFYAR